MLLAVVRLIKKKKYVLMIYKDLCNRKVLAGWRLGALGGVANRKVCFFGCVVFLGDQVDERIFVLVFILKICARMEYKFLVITLVAMKVLETQVNSN